MDLTGNLHNPATEPATPLVVIDCSLFALPQAGHSVLLCAVNPVVEAMVISPCVPIAGALVAVITATTLASLDGRSENEV
jgi:hypothetical protein